LADIYLDNILDIVNSPLFKIDFTALGTDPCRHIIDQQMIWTYSVYRLFFPSSFHHHKSGIAFYLHYYTPQLCCGWDNP
jgi:hypothetical protein